MPSKTDDKRLVFAAIADDDTGASDLAGMLAEEGLRTLLVIDLPSEEQFHNWSKNYQAVVMAEATRNLSPTEARRRTRDAVRLLETREPRVFQIKYCSTFDSTREGNIGPSIDAALDELREDFTIAVPALPINGRTTYQGYHFVGQQLLSDSPMRDHPLTPMTNPNLLALLGSQTSRQVALAPYSAVEAGEVALKRCFASLREQGASIVIVDCLNDHHLEIICRAAASLRLLTGSSAFGIKMPSIWRERGWLSDTGAQPEGLEKYATRVATEISGGCLIVAGSCSVATRGQNEWLAAQGVPVFRLEPRELLDQNFDRAGFAARVARQLAAGEHYLLATTDAPALVREAQEWANERGLSIPKLGQSIGDALAQLVLLILQDQNIGGLIVAGGETSGALCRGLQLGALRVGRNIEPGAPLCLSLGRFRLPVVLKSGNFGGADFYGKALRAVRDPATYMI